MQNLPQLKSEKLSLKAALSELALNPEYYAPITNYLSMANGKVSADTFVEIANRYRKKAIRGEIALRTYNKFITANKQFLRAYARRQNVSEQQRFVIEEKMRPVKGLRPREDVSNEKVFNREEIDLLKEKSGIRTAGLIEVLQQTGLRVTEAINLPAKMQRHDNHYSAFIIGKGGKQRRVYLAKKSYEKLKKIFNGKKFLLETRNHTQYNRANIYQLLRNAGEKVSIIGQGTLSKRLAPHRLRHSFATNALNRGLDLQTVSSYLGHSDISITAKFYIHRPPKPEEILSVYGVV